MVVGQSVHPAREEQLLNMVSTIMIMVIMRVVKMEMTMMMVSMGKLALSGQRSIETDGSRAVKGALH